MSSFTAANTARLVAAFDSSGIHRIGMPGDFASGEFLAAEAAAAGGEVARIPIAVNRTLVDEAFIECEGQRIDGLPMFDSPPTSAAGVAGALVANEGAGAIGYLDLPPNAASIKHMKFEKLRRASSHKALVVATRVTGESLAPINAQYYDQPFGPPVLLVAGANHESLGAWTQRAVTARLTCVHHREAIESYNVEAVVRSDGSQPPLYVVTPRTGWWESTAERAGGLVAWLAAVAAAARLKADGRLRCAVRTYATCGHELGHLGLSGLLRQEAGIALADKPVLHLGANLGCASSHALFLRAADPAQSTLMRDLLVNEGYPAGHVRIESIDVVSGEGRDLTEHGARVLSMAGANAHFHAASDRWPGNVSAANTAAIARAVARWVALSAGR